MKFKVGDWVTVVNIDKELYNTTKDVYKRYLSYLNKTVKITDIECGGSGYYGYWVDLKKGKLFFGKSEIREATKKEITKAVARGL